MRVSIPAINIGSEVQRLTKLDPQLWIGSGQFHAWDLRLLEANGINAVCNLTCETYAGYEGSSVEHYLQLHQNDCEEVPAAKLITFLAWMQNRDVGMDRVLIHCQMGISRAPSFAIAWRMFQFDVNRHSDGRHYWNRFRDGIARLRPCIDPHWKLRNSVLEYFAAR